MFIEIDPAAVLAGLSDLRRIREAIERLEHQQQSTLARPEDVELCDIIDQTIGCVTFHTTEIIERAKHPKSAALRACLQTHRVSTAKRLGRRLAAIATRASAGEFLVRHGKRDDGGVLFSIEKWVIAAR